MDFSISLQEFTELFRSIVPPKGLAYVGAGSGSSMGPYLNGAFQVGIVRLCTYICTCMFTFFSSLCS